MAVLRRLTVVLAIVAVMAATVEACPTCKIALGTHDKAQGDLVSAYMYSILFMMAMPFTLLGAFCTYMYVLVRRTRRNPSSGAAAEHEPEHETLGV
ncbi:MAG TPA: hypothetical protein VHZ24_09575 [Pirellulales bacterium]|jgi:hypothetical protein|nr:hypothetical protein [Pirellulales bacterium]